MKAPIGNSEWTLKQILRRSKKQSKRVIVDLRRCKRDDNKANRELLKYFKETKSLEELWIITKQNKLKKYKK
ncbi:hypothetical protein IKG13_00440 [Candidatus Saccharibacteria bacterium]|nr:hypothetical protein [Candidatus Saccharibacteria bacterium]MBR3377715.1 hypothetical protein [Candidatus Saccharibacteria bacterium]